MGWKNERLFKQSWSCDEMAAMSKCGTHFLKLFCSKTSKSMTFELTIQHQGLKYYKIHSNNDPGLTLTYFIAISKKLMEKSRECHSHKPQPIQTNKCMRSTQTSSIFPKRGDHNAKRNDETRGQRTHEDFKA